MPSFQHIYWFAPYNLTCPSTRYRGLLPLKQLAKEGVSYDFLYPQTSIKAYFYFLYLVGSIVFFRKKTP